MIRLLEFNAFSETRPLEPRALTGDHVGILDQDMTMVATTSKKGCHHSVSTSGLLHSSPVFYAVPEESMINLWMRCSWVETGGRLKHQKLLNKL